MNDNINDVEKRLAEMTQLKDEADIRLLRCEWVIGALSLIIILIPVIIVEVFPMEEWLKVVLIISGLVPSIIGIAFAVRIEQVAGYYECKCCKHRYVPTLKDVCFSPHMGRTRYMKCPMCGEVSWQKKVIGKK